MKLNWGTGIAITYGFFVLSMIGVVCASHRHDPGLVQKNYYDLDLNYQARLEKKQNAAALDAQPTLQYKAEGRSVTLRFPGDMTATEGTVKFYRPATTRDDFTIAISEKNSVDISAERMAPGRWYAECEWDAAGKKYYWEGSVDVY